MNNCVVSKNCINDDRGFSLVELVISVAILAIAVIPLMHSFTLAAKTNGKAGSVQNATSLAESIMEEVKAMSLDELIDEYYYEASSGGHDVDYYTKNGMSKADVIARDNDFTAVPPGYKGTIMKEADDFYVLHIPEVSANNGEKFNVVVTINSTAHTSDDDEYANTSHEEGTGIDKVDDANIVELPVLERINIGENVAISTEFNRHDESAVAKLIDLYYDIKPNEVEIDDNTRRLKTSKITLHDKKKTTTIDVSRQTGMTIVTATVKYSVNITSTAPSADAAGVPVSYEKVIYSGSFDNEPKLYLFYKTMNEYLDMEYQAPSTDTSGKSKFGDKPFTGTGEDIYLIDSEEIVFTTNDTTNLANAYVMLDKYYGPGVTSDYEYDLVSNDTENLYTETIDGVANAIRSTSNISKLNVTPNSKVNLTTYIDGVSTHLYDTESGTYLYKINVMLTKDDGSSYAFITSNKAAD